MYILTTAWDSLLNFGAWLKNHDLPNWFSIVIWPVVLFWWSNRYKTKPRELTINFEIQDFTDNGERIINLKINLKNCTTSDIYLTNAFIENPSKLISFHETALDDKFSCSYELKFALKNNLQGGIHNLANAPREITLHTGDEAFSSLRLACAPANDILSYRRSFSYRWIRKYFYIRKYFCIKFNLVTEGKLIRVYEKY